MERSWLFTIINVIKTKTESSPMKIITKLNANPFLILIPFVDANIKLIQFYGNKAIADNEVKAGDLIFVA